MPFRWTGWEDDPHADPDGGRYRTPYVDWYLETGIAGLAERGLRLFGQKPRARDSRFDFALPDLPLPPGSVRPEATAIVEPEPRRDLARHLTVPPGQDDIVVGVIDAGLAPAHARFRRTGATGTRILSFWQQGGRWQGQTQLPFGRELFQRDIDALMGGGSQVDEARFNRRAGLVDFADPAGERWIETAAPHGTHAADLAVGCDPCDPAMERLRARAHLVMVELAPRLSIGPAGNFVEYYAIWAIRHIVETADALWRELHAGHARTGFPVVINLSYGLHAGPKDGSMDIQRFVRALNLGRDPRAPVRIVMPAGNDNLERGSAVLGGAGARAIDWRILPEDRSASHAEIWTDPVPAGRLPGHRPGPAAIRLVPPGGPAGPRKTGRDRQRCTLVDTATARPVARIYCRATAADDDAAGYRGVGYFLCIAPTWRPGGVAAPAGAWRIAIGRGPLAKLHIQSDQRILPGRGEALLSYFENTARTPAPMIYAAYHPDGTLRDTYRVDPVSGQVQRSDSSGPIRRQNTMNALAGSFGILTIGGYRARDLLPAAYSATGRGFGIGGAAADIRDPGAADSDPGGGKARMEAAAVSDDSLWRAGRLAAGGRSGAAAVLQGTSFACAEATRIVALTMLDWLDAGAGGRAPASATAFEVLAAASDRALVARQGGPPAADLPDKLGAGRLPRQDHGRLPR